MFEELGDRVVSLAPAQEEGFGGGFAWSKYHKTFVNVAATKSLSVCPSLIKLALCLRVR
jgi:hypothetical protein